MRAYQHATAKILDGALTMQQIDKQRELDRYLARQKKHKTPVNEAHTAKECRTTVTTISANNSHSHGEVSHV